MLVSAKHGIEDTERVSGLGVRFGDAWFGVLVIGYPFGVFNPSSLEQDLFNLQNSYLRRALCVQFFLSSVI